jgi:hypothetical protein
MWKQLLRHNTKRKGLHRWVPELRGPHAGAVRSRLEQPPHREEPAELESCPTLPACREPGLIPVVRREEYGRSMPKGQASEVAAASLRERFGRVGKEEWKGRGTGG